MIGARGAEVKKAQRALHLVEDGIFGNITKEAVADFQKTHGLTPDGIIGDATWEALMSQPMKSARTIDEIIVHCSATQEGRDYRASDIKRWHTQPVSKGGRGWSDIGYHYVVDLDGRIEGGRPIDQVGAHCTNHNAHSIGVCYIGGCAKDGKTAKDTRTWSQKSALRDLLKELKRLHPNSKIRGHRDFANKACPSFDATNEYKDL